MSRINNNRILIFDLFKLNVFNILHSDFLTSKENNISLTNFNTIMKRIFTLLFAVLLIASCGGKKTEGDKAANQAQNETAISQTPVKLNLAEFDKQASELVGKEVIVSGIVDHTCKHSGKRMFLVDDKTDASLKVEAGKNIDQFDASLTGSTVEVRGIVKELVIDNSKIDEWEENPDLNGESGLKMHEGEHEKSESNAEEEEKAEKIKMLKQKLEKSGKDHISFYSLECISYKIVK